MAKQAATYKVKDFVPNDQKAQEIEQQVSKQNKKEEEDTKEPEESSLIAVEDQKKNKEIREKAEAIISSKDKKELKVEEFEKDEDENFHIDFIYSMANIRAKNYALQEMDWITVKIKAGNIVPALATTTAAIAMQIPFHHTAERQIERQAESEKDTDSGTDSGTDRRTPHTHTHTLSLSLCLSLS